MPSRYSLLLGSLLVLIAITVVPSLAWGSDGHRVVAQIAQNLLTPKALSAVKKQIANGLDLSSIALQPDFYRGAEGAWSSGLHFVNVPTKANAVDIERDCDRGCVITAIYNYTTILFDRRANISSYTQCNASAPDTVEPCALSFLTHFMGDLHQPLHISFLSDKGGNRFNVSWYGNCSNLHSVWDSKMIIKYLDGRKWTSLADEISATLAKHEPLTRRWLSDASVEMWANESLLIGMHLAYNLEPGNHPIEPYLLIQQSQSSASKQLLQEQAAFDTQSPSSIRMNTRSTSTNMLREILHGNTRAWKSQKREVRITPDIHIRDASTFNAKIEAESCNGPEIGDSFYSRNMWRVKQRLAMAGVRLAYVLNNIYE